MNTSSKFVLARITHYSGGSVGMSAEEILGFSLRHQQLPAGCDVDTETQPCSKHPQGTGQSCQGYSGLGRVLSPD